MNRAVRADEDAFAAIDRDFNRGWPADRGQLRDLAGTSDALDQLRPGSTNNLRVAKRRVAMQWNPKLPDEVPSGRTDLAVRAIDLEARLRTDARARGEQFVADWRALSAEQARVGEGEGAYKLEQRIDRLVERMQADPMLERALDRHIPEHRLQIEEAIMHREQRYDMGM